MSVTGCVTIVLPSSQTRLYTTMNAGDRIVLLANNSDYLCEALLAVAAAGAIATPLNTRWTAQEVAAATQLSSPILVICEAAFYQLLERFLSAGQVEPCLFIHEASLLSATNI